jgi:uncharacterized membrane protein
MPLILSFLIGITAGLRSMTAPAVVAWAVWLGRLKLDFPLALIGHPVTVVVMTVLAVAELVVDKLPKTPARTAPLGLCARVVSGGLTGACIAAAGGQAAVLGAVLGAVGGIAGAFAGYRARSALVKRLGVADFVIAVAEDLLAVGGGAAIVANV